MIATASRVLAATAILVGLPATSSALTISYLADFGAPENTTPGDEVPAQVVYTGNDFGPIVNVTADGATSYNLGAATLIFAGETDFFNISAQEGNDPSSINALSGSFMFFENDDDVVVGGTTHDGSFVLTGVSATDIVSLSLIGSQEDDGMDPKMFDSFVTFGGGPEVQVDSNPNASMTLIHTVSGSTSYNGTIDTLPCGLDTDLANLGGFLVTITIPEPGSALLLTVAGIVMMSVRRVRG